MIKKLQSKFIWIAAVSLALVIVIILGSINLLKFRSTTQQADEMLLLLSENGGRFPDSKKDKADKPGSLDKPPINADTRFKTRYFLVWLDASNRVIRVDTGKIAAVTSDQAVAYGECAAARSKEWSYDGVYRYRIVPDERQPGNRMVIFLDCSSELESNRTFLILSCGIGAGAFLLALGVAVLFSRRAIRPIQEAMEKQQRFLADASHELKTPLAIIAANNDVLELTAGKSRWTDSTRSQVSRMDGLLQSMLALTRMEIEQPALHMEPLNLSALVSAAAESFDVLASANHIRLDTRIAGSVHYTGDRACLQQLLSILLENAVKYAGENGYILLILEAQGKKARLTVENSCAELPAGDLNRLFDRFYRADTSRSRQTGGYGIGLSIARSICCHHHASISAHASGDHAIQFIVQF